MSQLTLFTDETWAPVPEWENRYSVSDKGRVRSLLQDTILTPRTNGHPNRKAELYRGGDRTTKSIPKLVVEVFGEPPPDEEWVVKHLDGDKSNNEIENLKPVSKASLGGSNINGRESKSTEGWEPIPGWGGEYLAHRSGKILSAKSNKVLSVRKRSGGSYTVSLTKNGRRLRRNPGRLIIKTFQDPVLEEENWIPYRLNGEKDFSLSNLVPKPTGSSYSTGRKPAYQKMHRQYRDRAKRKGVRFVLSEEDFSDLCCKDCYYCGARPSYMKSVDGIVNGIDRLYPNVGYVRKNCVPCCSECNVGKATSTPSDFVERAIRIANRHSPNDIRIPRSSVDMSGYT